MKTRIHPRKPVYALVVAILVAASFLAGSVASKGQPANAQGAGSASGPAAPGGGHVCSIGYVAVYGNRIQVWCTNSVGAIDSFAAPFASAAESRQTNRLLAMLISGQALNKQVVLWYNDNPAFNPPGCDAVGCRLLEGVVIQ